MKLISLFKENQKKNNKFVKVIIFHLLKTNGQMELFKDIALVLLELLPRELQNRKYWGNGCVASNIDILCFLLKFFLVPMHLHNSYSTIYSKLSKQQIVGHVVW